MKVVEKPEKKSLYKMKGQFSFTNISPQVVRKDQYSISTIIKDAISLYCSTIHIIWLPILGPKWLQEFLSLHPFPIKRILSIPLYRLINTHTHTQDYSILHVIST